MRTILIASIVLSAFAASGQQYTPAINPEYHRSPRQFATAGRENLPGGFEQSYIVTADKLHVDRLTLLKQFTQWMHENLNYDHISKVNDTLSTTVSIKLPDENNLMLQYVSFEFEGTTASKQVMYRVKNFTYHARDVLIGQDIELPFNNLTILGENQKQLIYADFNSRFYAIVQSFDNQFLKQ